MSMYIENYFVTQNMTFINVYSKCNRKNIVLCYWREYSTNVIVVKVIVLLKYSGSFLNYVNLFYHLLRKKCWNLHLDLILLATLLAFTLCVLSPINSYMYLSFLKEFLFYWWTDLFISVYCVMSDLIPDNITSSEVCFVWC